MARNPIVFQNGTLVSNAKVEVGGTIYDVTPAEYEGTTPLSANNLNQLQTNLYDYIDEKTQKHAITLESSTTPVLTAGSKIPFNTIRTQIGTSITANTTSNRIIIGAGVNTIKISAQIQGKIQVTSFFELRKNGNVIKTSYMSTNGSYTPIVFSPFLEEVDEGDYFEIYITEGNFTVSSGLGDNSLCYMTVEKIN